MAKGDVRVAITGDDSDLARTLQGANAKLATFGKTAGEGAAKASFNFNTLRGSMTSLAQAALQTAPGVATVTSALGNLAFGAGLTTAVIAGAAAIGFAWRKLTQEARDLKKATEEAHGAAAQLRISEGGPITAAGVERTKARLAQMGWQEKIAGYQKSGVLVRNDRVGTQITPAFKDQVTTALSEEARLREEVATWDALILKLRKEQAAVTATGISREQSFADLNARNALGSIVSMSAAGIRSIRPNVRTIQSGLVHTDSLNLATSRSLQLPAASILRTGSATAAGPTASSSFDRSGAAMIALNAAQGLTGGGGAGALLGGIGSLAGLAVGGPTGAAVGGGIANLLTNLLGSRHEREEEQYRAHARALREAAGQLFTINLYLPAGNFYDTNNPDFQEALIETIEAATGNRNGRVQVVR